MFAFAVALVMSQVEAASEPKMPNGASTLLKAAFAFGFDMGLDAHSRCCSGFVWNTG
jgi:hypothetical protein